MKVLKISEELSKQFFTIRNSYEAALKALTTTLPDVPDEDRYNFYVNAFKDLCECSVQTNILEKEIMETLGISGWEKIEIDKVYVREESDNDN